MKLTELNILYTEHIPQELENGVLYISKEFRLAIHLCACGCGIQSVTPINRGNAEWVLSEHENGSVSLSPSIGNFKGESPYHAHYFITSNQVIWC